MTASRRPGVLLLIHRGAAFVDELLHAANELGLEGYVLTSAPSDATGARLRALAERAAWLRATEATSLGEGDVFDALGALAAEGRDVRACITVWEGYRLAMARANAAIGAPDVWPDALVAALDKLHVRDVLRASGLSRVEAELLTPASLPRLARDGRRRFVKPRRGVASFGAFSFRADLGWADLEAIRAEMAADAQFREIFAGHPDFVAEDFIAGTEFSFEALACDGEVRTIAVHEKLEVEERHGATLECACVSPPTSIDADALQRGRELVARTLGALSLSTGCFHVEMRFDGARWEVIEVNPRVGGSFIHKSVLVSTGACLLDLWLRVLVARTEEERAAVRARLAAAAEPASATDAAFFRVYYGEPGRTIRETRAVPIAPEAEAIKVVVPNGTTLPRSTREVFVAQALWRLPRADARAHVEALRKTSTLALEISYA